MLRVQIGGTVAEGVDSTATNDHIMESPQVGGARVVDCFPERSKPLGLSAKGLHARIIGVVGRAERQQVLDFPTLAPGETFDVVVASW
jgi:hypothetical protein